MAILTAAAQFGCGSKEILQEVGTSLNYDLVNKRRLMNDIRACGVKWEKWAKELDESSPGLWERYDRSFRGFWALLQSILLDYALQDNVMLKGRGANFLLEGIPYAFRIRFVASQDSRIESISLRDSLPQAKVRSLIEKSDEDKAGAIFAVYGKDVNDAQSYDAVFDTGRQSVSEMADAIIQGLLSRNELNTPAARRILSMRAVAAKIKAKVVMDSRLYVPVFDVICTETELVLKGIVRNSDQYEGIVDAARELLGEFSLKVQLRYRV